MTEESISSLLGRDESQVFERKQSLSKVTEGLESLCAMINTGEAQGTVVFGIAPDGKLVGVESGDLDKAQQSLLQRIDSKFEPRPLSSIRVVVYEGKRFVVLIAMRNCDVSYHEFDGRAYIREGTVTRQLSLAEKQSLQRMRNRDQHTGPWKCDRCGSRAGMLHQVVMTNTGSYKTYDCDCGGQYWPDAWQSS